MAQILSPSGPMPGNHRDFRFMLGCYWRIAFKIKGKNLHLQFYKNGEQIPEDQFQKLFLFIQIIYETNLISFKEAKISNYYFTIIIK